MSGSCATHRNAVSSVYGIYGGGKRNLFGERANFTASAVFGGSVTALHVLERHTFFGIYGRALSKSGAAAWADFLAEGKRVGKAAPMPWTKLSASGFRIATRELRSCSKCVSRDLEEHGLAFWHVLHHLPPVHHCPIHGIRLAPETFERANGHFPDFTLPTKADVAKTELPSSEIESEGYASYLRLWVSLLDGRMDLVAADKWSSCIASLAVTFGSEHDAVHAINQEISEHWGCSSDRVAELLGNHVQHDFVAMELQQKANAFRVAQKLVLLTACESLGVVDTTGTQQMSLALPSALAPSHPLRPEDALRTSIVDMGIPLAIVPALVRARSLREVARITGVSRPTIRAAIAGLTPDELAILRDQSLRAGNGWLSKRLEHQMEMPDR
jgi:hypothetical protein